MKRCGIIFLGTWNGFHKQPSTHLGRKNYEEKKSLKKVTSAVLVAAMSMGLLAGCGGSKSSEEAKTDADGATVIKFGIHVANPKKQETVTYNIVQGFNKEIKENIK